MQTVRMICGDSAAPVTFVIGIRVPQLQLSMTAVQVQMH